MTTPVPDEAVTAAALVLADTEDDDSTYRALADDILRATAPLIRADERDRVTAAIRRAMGDEASLHLCRAMLDGHRCNGRTLAELIGEGDPS